MRVRVRMTSSGIIMSIDGYISCITYFQIGSLYFFLSYIPDCTNECTTAQLYSRYD